MDLVHNYSSKYVIYIFLINLASFALFRIDKHLSKGGKIRISEKNLFIAAFIGGAIGAWCGMYIGENHKTNKFSFKFGIPFILMVEIVFAAAKICNIL